MKSAISVIGDPIQASCPKCRKITCHTIVTMNEKHATEVQCNTCKLTSAAKKPTVRRVADPQKALREAWATLQPGMDCTKAADYSMTGAFKVKSLVNHEVFGLGLVQRVSGPQKMVVLFADGEKVMRCK